MNLFWEWQRVEHREIYDYECCCITFHDSFGVKHSAGRRHGWGLANWGAFPLSASLHIFPTLTKLFLPNNLFVPPRRVQFTSSPLFHQLDPGASARLPLGPVQSGFKSLFFVIISLYIRLHMSLLSQKHHLYHDKNVRNCCSWLWEASLICWTFHVDCFCLCFHNFYKGFMSFKSVSPPAAKRLIMQWQKVFSHSAVLIKLNFFPKLSTRNWKIAALLGVVGFVWSHFAPISPNESGLFFYSSTTFPGTTFCDREPILCLSKQEKLVLNQPPAPTVALELPGSKKGQTFDTVPWQEPIIK